MTGACCSSGRRWRTTPCSRATSDVLAGLRGLRPEAPTEELAELGHYPQLEDPNRFAEALSKALSARVGPSL
jgi:hypothetical protein